MTQTLDYRNKTYDEIWKNWSTHFLGPTLPLAHLEEVHRRWRRIGKLAQNGRL